MCRTGQLQLEELILVSAETGGGTDVSIDVAFSLDGCDKGVYTGGGGGSEVVNRRLGNDIDVCSVAFRVAKYASTIGGDMRGNLV